MKALFNLINNLKRIHQAGYSLTDEGLGLAILKVKPAIEKVKGKKAQLHSHMAMDVVIDIATKELEEDLAKKGLSLGNRKVISMLDQLQHHSNTSTSNISLELPISPNDQSLKDFFKQSLENGQCPALLQEELNDLKVDIPDNEVRNYTFKSIEQMIKYHTQNLYAAA